MKVNLRGFVVEGGLKECSLAERSAVSRTFISAQYYLPEQVFQRHEGDLLDTEDEVLES
jgi:hypothetical protein